jgi:hypothetical protein
MVKVPKDWERRLIELAAVHGVSDFITRGRLTKVESKAFFAILNKLGRATTRAAPRLGATAWLIARRHPVVAVTSLWKGDSITY